MATLLRTDLCSVTGQNLAMITAEAKIDPLAISRQTLIKRIGDRREIPSGDEWVLEAVSDLMEELDIVGNTEEMEQIRETLDVISMA